MVISKFKFFITKCFHIFSSDSITHNYLKFPTPLNFHQILSNIHHSPHPLTNPKGCFSTKPPAEHAPSNHSLALTPTCPTTAPPLLTGNPPTWCTNFSMWTVMLWTSQKHEWAAFHMCSFELWSIDTCPDQIPPAAFTGMLIPLHDTQATNHIYCQFEMAYQLVLQFRKSPGIDIRYNSDSHPWLFPHLHYPTSSTC